MKNNKSKRTASPKKRKKKQQTILFWVGLGCFVLLGVVAYNYYTPPVSLSAAPTADNINTGAQLFAKNCASCHGPGARGQDPQQPMGGTLPNGGYLAPALNGTGHAWHHPNEMLFNIIKNGSIADDSSMLGFKGKLSDDEIVMVIQYFKSLWPPEIQMRHAQRSQ